MTPLELSEQEIAQAVADGVALPWSALEASADTDDDRALLRQFKALAAIADVEERPLAAGPWNGLEVRDRVGRGTFGTVYTAWDPALDRIVALKLLHTPAASAADLRQRSTKEGRLLARVRHPNVVHVYGAAEADGRVGLWTEFVEGRTLREIVADDGAFSARESILIGIDLCSALAAVHGAGLLHGDIKAQNVMRESGGRIVLMDFGAGSLLSSDDDAGRLTGTPAYLAPELLEGVAPSKASDLYALGVLLFFLSAGAFPFPQTSIDELRDAHATGTRIRLRDARPDLPGPFIDVVERALERDVSARPQSAGEFEARLVAALGNDSARPSSRRRLLWVVVGLGVTAAAIAGSIYAATATPAVRNEIRLAAVRTPSNEAPLKNLAATTDLELSAQMALASAVRIVPRDEPKSDAPVLDAVCERDASGVRIDARVVSANGRTEIWSDSFGRDAGEAVELPAEAARGIAIALRTRLDPAQWRRVVQSAGGKTDAAQTYLRGMSHLASRRRPELHRARTLFEQAVQASPKFSLALAGRAEALTLLGLYGEVPLVTALDEARISAERSVAADANVAEGHAILGYVSKLQLRFNDAEKSLKTAIALNPALTDAHVRLSTVYLQRKQPESAIAEMKSALALEPSSVPVRSQFLVTLALSRRDAEALSEAQAFITAFPARPIGHQVLAEVQINRRDPPAADRAIDAALGAQGAGSADTSLLVDRAIVSVLLGDRARASGIAADLERRFGSHDAASAIDIAAVRASLGERDQAFAWLNRAVERNEPGVGYLLVESKWDGLRADPRFLEILKRVRLNSNKE